MNVKELHRGIRRLASELDPESAQRDAQEHEAIERQHLNRSQKEIWLISRQKEEVGSKAGQVVSAVPMVAARWIQEQTHELATPEQIAAHKRHLAAEKVRIEKEEADRKGVSTTEMLATMTATLQAVTAANSGRHREGVKG